MWDANWDALVKGSKFNQWPAFAKSKKGHIDLQDHNCDVWFRDIKIKHSNLIASMEDWKYGSMEVLIQLNH